MTCQKPSGLTPIGRVAVLAAAIVAAFLSSVWLPAHACMAGCQGFSERGLHETAIRYCSAVLNDPSTTNHSNALFFRANSYYSIGDREAALDDVNEALASSKDNLRALALRGAIRLANGNLRTAIKDFDDAIENGFDDTQVLRNRATAWLALGEPANAMGDLEKITAYSPDDFISLTQLALAHHANGELDEANSVAERALAANSGYAAAYGVRAAIAAAKGNTASALAEYSMARGAAPGDPGYRVGRASMLLAAGSPRVALNEVNKALEFGPDLQPALALRADILQELGDFEGALADLDQLTASGGKAALRRARLAVLLNGFDRAEADYTTALGEMPGNADAYFERAQIRAQLNRPEDAVIDYSKALELDTELGASGILLMRGRARFDTGDLEGAASDFAAEIARTPDAASPRIWHIRTLSDLSDQAGAEAGARVLLELEPMAPRAHAILGDVLLRKGDLAAGRAAHQRAIELNPDYRPSHERLEQIAQ